MPHTDRIAAHLPFLRRYARALTGSQASGDAHVRAVLEALVAGEAHLNEGLSPRVALYRLFHAAWAGPANRFASQSDSEASSPANPEQRLQTLAPMTRQALLLNALEGFSFKDIGAILGVTTAEAEGLAREAQLEIEQQLATNILIIEDEAMIALDIKELAEELGHSVSAIARTREEAVRLAREYSPRLVLADIMLADDSSGVDAVRDILADFDAPVVFVTAYPERLLTGERPEPAYLITKPFERSALKAAISQALFFHHSREPA
jgi:CheY-like chemotaxis protein/DNA-directed RNA polymerase specialized sigma24 family protein